MGVSEFVSVVSFAGSLPLFPEASFFWLFQKLGRTSPANGKVLVNDPNDSDAKNYINREFDMMSEIHATANAYWIFDKK